MYCRRTTQSKALTLEVTQVVDQWHHCLCPIIVSTLTIRFLNTNISILTDYAQFIEQVHWWKWARNRPCFTSHKDDSDEKATWGQRDVRGQWVRAHSVGVTPRHWRGKQTCIITLNIVITWCIIGLVLHTLNDPVHGHWQTFSESHSLTCWEHCTWALHSLCSWDVIVTSFGWFRPHSWMRVGPVWSSHLHICWEVSTLVVWPASHLLNTCQSIL